MRHHIVECLANGSWSAAAVSKHTSELRFPDLPTLIDCLLNDSKARLWPTQRGVPVCSGILVYSLVLP